MKRELLTTGKVCTLAVLAGPASFLSFDSIGVFVGRLLRLAVPWLARAWAFLAAHVV